MNLPIEDNSKDFSTNLLDTTAVKHNFIDSSQKVIDNELFIKRILEEEPRKGYEMLFRKYYAPLCSHAIRYVYSKEVAEDIVAEVFYNFWHKAIYKQIDTSLRAYLYTMVRNRCFTYLKSEYNNNNTDDIVDWNGASQLPQPDKVLEYDELYMQVERVISTLPQQCRKVFLLSRFEGKKYSEIASELGVSQKAVEAHVSKALAELRKGLKNYGLVSLLVFSILMYYSK
ncbi:MULTISPECIES: RNA polymerase sigma-70 factor [Arcicella]|uniref:RNA polymerase sigma-70 factor n=1 Tax=Arcicella lustrica TaxID=2984196 RepID=A0ABU5SKA2_9BACT|nr:RNA polymerase sigma-70 factor [Arcicella sp. DC25W]MEA5427729.1 RNA polymerase sigma-70 factor [Arcicella sp. DC25W]